MYYINFMNRDRDLNSGVIEGRYIYIYIGDY